MKELIMPEFAVLAETCFPAGRMVDCWSRGLP